MPNIYASVPMQRVLEPNVDVRFGKPVSKRVSSAFDFEIVAAHVGREGEAKRSNSERIGGSSRRCGRVKMSIEGWRLLARPSYTVETHGGDR